MPRFEKSAVQTPDDWKKIKEERFNPDNTGMSEYGGELRIMGGVDKMALKAGKDEIKSYLKSIERTVANGGYIPFCDHLCPPDVSEENYLYYLDLKEQMFGLK